MISGVKHKIQHKEIEKVMNSDKKYFKPFENYDLITNPTVRIWKFID